MVVNNYDIAIVGGGIQGLFLAYYAKKMYERKSVVLFESRIVGSGVTGYSGHLHMPYGTGNKKELTKQSLLLYAELCSEFKNFPIEKRRFIGICGRNSLGTIIRDITEDGVQIDSVEYGLKVMSENHAIISGISGFVTSRNVSNYLMEVIAGMGVLIFEGTEVKDISKNDGFFELNTQSGIRFRCCAVFNCSGVAILDLVNHLNKRLRTKKVIAFHINQRPLKDDPITYFFDDDAFILPQPYYSRYLFSYKCEEWDIKVDYNSYSIKSEDIKSAKNVLDKYTNDFSSKMLGGQVNIDIYNTPSSSPLITKINENYYVVGATGGSGVRLAPGLAISVLKMMQL